MAIKASLELMEEDWDIAIILDACRYDFFKRFYRYFFEGYLERAVSRGSCTAEWFRKTFTSTYDDTVYVSGNPFINSYFVTVKGCCARKHFRIIVDVWARFWDSMLGTVPPQSMNKSLLKTFEHYRGKRIIAHYLQHHAPYISPRYFVAGFSFPNIREGNIFTLLPSALSIDKSETSNVFRFRKASHRLEVPLNWVEKIVRRTNLGNGVVLELRRVLKMPPKSPLDATRRLYGTAGLRRAYTINLLIVLETLTYVLENLDGRIVITSDHGEFLGEKNMFRHPCGVKDPILRHVPYFIVKKVRKPKKPVFSLYPLKLKIRLMRRLRRKQVAAV